MYPGLHTKALAVWSRITRFEFTSTSLQGLQFFANITDIVVFLCYISFICCILSLMDDDKVTSSMWNIALNMWSATWRTKSSIYAYIYAHILYTITYSCHLWLTNSEFEVIEGVFVDNIQFPHQGECKLYHGPYVHVLPVVLLGNSEIHCEWHIPFKVNAVVLQFPKLWEVSLERRPILISTLNPKPWTLAGLTDINW